MRHLFNTLISLTFLFLGFTACAATEQQSTTKLEKYQGSILPGAIAARMGEYWVEPDACESAESVSIVYTPPFYTKGFLISLYKSHDSNEGFAFWRVKTLTASGANQDTDGYSEQIIRTYTQETTPEEFDSLVSRIDFNAALKSNKSDDIPARNLDGDDMVGRIALCNNYGLFYKNEGDDNFELVKKAFQPFFIEAKSIFPDLEAIISIGEME